MTVHSLCTSIFTAGIDICKSYTAVPSSLVENQMDPELLRGRFLYLMIKIYAAGDLTPFISKLKTGKKCVYLSHHNMNTYIRDSSYYSWLICWVPGDKIEVSNFAGSFLSSRLSECEYLVMFAAGTGITPMLGLIQQTLHGLYRKPNRLYTLYMYIYVHELSSILEF